MHGQLVSSVTERDHAQGGAHARITLVEYGDYQCPHCGHAYGIVKALQERLGTRLRFVFRNFPLREAHAHAEAAAEAAEAAGAQGQFWAMHDLIFEHQQNLGASALLHHAERIGLDTARFTRDLQAHSFAARVQEDFTTGLESGVNGTPTFFINGLYHDGSFDEESLLLAIEAADGGA